jgi:dTDP-4-dehydrorhamnose reductase
MRLLITGARGLLGRTCLGVANEEHEPFGFDIDDLDVTDREAVDRAVSDLRPEAVLHCAAYTNVDGAEVEPEHAMEVNARGAEHVARAARRVGATVVYVSTDYVFDGEGRVPYRESDVPRPLSQYGRSKLAGERGVVQTAPETHLIVRTAWLYGGGAGFVDWVCRKLDSGETLRLVTDHVGSPTYAADLAEALLRLVEQGHRGVYHFVNKGETSWLGWGRAIAELAGCSLAPFEPVTSEQLGRAASRPSYSVLAVDKYEGVTGCRVPPWRDALKRYLASAGRLREGPRS